METNAIWTWSWFRIGNENGTEKEHCWSNDLPNPNVRIWVRVKTRYESSANEPNTIRGFDALAFGFCGGSWVKEGRGGGRNI